MAIQTEVSEKEMRGKRKWKNSIFWYYNFHYLNYCTPSWVFLQGHCFAAKHSFFVNFTEPNSVCVMVLYGSSNDSTQVRLDHISTFLGYYYRTKWRWLLGKPEEGILELFNPLLFSKLLLLHSSLLKCCRCYPWLNFPISLI